MKKKIILALVAIVAVAGSVAGMSAFEAHVINVTAKIENALAVSAEAIDFGTVFPQETLYEGFTIQLSSSFLSEERVDDVNYVIKQKPKPLIQEDAQWCHDNLPEITYNPQETVWINYLEKCYYPLCSYLSKMPDGEPENDGSLSAFHSIGTIVNGRLAKSEGDEIDSWTIDLDVPCFGGMCAQDWTHQGWELPAQLESEVFGCDLWIEVTGISRVGNVNLENKYDNWDIISDDSIHGVMTYSTDYPTFYGNVVAQGLETNAKYQITLNGPGGCSATDNLLASAGSNLFESGYWNNWAPGLAPNCDGNPGEGVYNMALINNEYTAKSDGAGNLNYSFNLNLPTGDYAGVKVLVKKTLDPYEEPWIDPATEHTTNLFETASISFTVLP